MGGGMRAATPSAMRSSPFRGTDGRRLRGGLASVMVGSGGYLPKIRRTVGVMPATPITDSTMAFSIAS